MKTKTRPGADALTGVCIHYFASHRVTPARTAEAAMTSPPVTTPVFCLVVINSLGLDVDLVADFIGFAVFRLYACGFLIGLRTDIELKHGAVAVSGLALIIGVAFSLDVNDSCDARLGASVLFSYASDNDEHADKTYQTRDDEKYRFDPHR